MSPHSSKQRTRGGACALRSYVLAVAVWAVGCASDKVAIQYAARDFDCPEHSVQTRELSDNVYQVRGCGQMTVYECSAAESECYRNGRYSAKALERAGREFECPRSSVDITWIAIDTYRARGCGQQVNYSCDADTCYAEGAKPVPAQVNVVQVVNQPQPHYEYHPPH